jgi:hypothetical protein
VLRFNVTAETTPATTFTITAPATTFTATIPTTATTSIHKNLYIIQTEYGKNNFLLIEVLTMVNNNRRKNKGV